MTAPDATVFELDGELVGALPGESLWQAALRHGVEIPHLCHTDGLRPDGNCRACVVEIDGERTLAPSCCRAPAPGMRVRAQSPRARAAQRMVVELLLSDMPEAGYQWRDGPGEENTIETIAANADWVSANGQKQALFRFGWNATVQIIELTPA